MKRATRAEWAERVGRWRASGQSAREYAGTEGWKPQTLLWWSAELGRAERRRAQFIEIAALSTNASETRVEEGRIEVVVREQIRILVSGAFDASVLRRVVEALEAR